MTEVVRQPLSEGDRFALQHYQLTRSDPTAALQAQMRRDAQGHLVCERCGGKVRRGWVYQFGAIVLATCARPLDACSELYLKGVFIMHVPDTEIRWVVKTIMPATGWQVVYDMDEGHAVVPAYVLALAYAREYDRKTGRLVTSRFEEDELWEVVALAYSHNEGFSVCREMDVYCGLLPSGTTLADFEANLPVRHGWSAERKEPLAHA